MDRPDNGHGQHPLVMPIPDLDRDFAGVGLRQAVSSDLGRSGCGLTFGSLKAVELQALFIRRETGPSRTSQLN
jgi:hypothetical protein